MLERPIRVFRRVFVLCLCVVAGWREMRWFDQSWLVQGLRWLTCAIVRARHSYVFVLEAKTFIKSSSRTFRKVLSNGVYEAWNGACNRVFQRIASWPWDLFCCFLQIEFVYTNCSYFGSYVMLCFVLFTCFLMVHAGKCAQFLLCHFAQFENTSSVVLTLSLSMLTCERVITFVKVSNIFNAIAFTVVWL